MKYNLAIVGFGGMGSYHFSSIREQLPEINVVGAYDIREERRNAAKEQGLKAYGSLEELEQDETIDIVLVATPNNFLKDLSIRCSGAGKNVVCEKPVTMNAAELGGNHRRHDRNGEAFFRTPEQALGQGFCYHEKNCGREPARPSLSDRKPRAGLQARACGLARL